VSVDIYALTDPRDGAVRYVGKSRDAERRYRQHLGERRRKTPVYSWIASLAEQGLVPGLTILGVCNESEWKERERAMIAQLRAEGLRLLNLADGGDEPWCSSETRAANGRRVAAARDKLLWRLKRDLGAALKAGHVSDATKAKMRARLDVFGQFAGYL
jgi:hypothetical protein